MGTAEDDDAIHRLLRRPLFEGRHAVEQSEEFFFPPSRASRCSMCRKSAWEGSSSTSITRFSIRGRESPGVTPPTREPAN